MSEKQSLEFQLDWDVHKLHGRWPSGPDNLFLMGRLANLTCETTVAGARGRVLEVAAAEGIHSCKISLRGLPAFILEPSAAMIEQARRRMEEFGASVTVVRGVAETMPFRDGSFDRVLLDSAIDHLADPELSIREMARLLAPDGRLVVSFVNYGGVSVRVSRLLYRLGRALRVASADEHYFWDTPVPIEHTFECTLPILRKLCEPYLELDHGFGVSLGWMTPGWGPLLKRLATRRVVRWLRRLDELAYARPNLADFVFTVWRRKEPPPSPLLGKEGGRKEPPPSPLLGKEGGRKEPPPSPLLGKEGGPIPPPSLARRGPGGGSYVVRPDNVVYPGKVQAEAEYWAKRSFGSGFFAILSKGDREANRLYTGDPERSWLDDLASRGPFRHAAVLGCDEAGYEAAWLRKNASEQLDVYELSPGVIRKVRAGLGTLRFRLGLPPVRARFHRADLNFFRLPRERYDVMWSSGCLHHIVNLEHLFAQVEQALRPGGLFAVHDYVGERRLQYDERRLRRINEVLSLVPARFRRSSDLVTPPRVEQLSPFCGVRSDEVLERASERFEVVHLAAGGALFPLPLVVDVPAIEREAPDLKRRLEEAEAEAMRDPTLRPCGAYAVFRKRSADRTDPTDRSDPSDQNIS